MYRLSSIIIGCLFLMQLFGQNPHGEQLKMDCAVCHSPGGWTELLDPMAFDHDTTDFSLDGSHRYLDCAACHSSLVFSEASTQCIDCHLDVHAQTVGDDCMRCHDTQDWLVDHIPELHEENGFPLIAAHTGLACASCHVSETNLRFERLGNDCINCHQQDFMSTTSPDHMASGFSQDCLECHDPLGFSWNTDIIDHSFFPLVLGHEPPGCTDCHLSNDLSDISPDCVSCHEVDFLDTQEPDHQAAGFGTDCAACHTLDPGWTPATFDHDAEHFPIYSGSHNGVWMECMECHPSPDDYSIFTCVSCHTDPETSDEHNGISGYLYEDNACLVCHPNGLAEEGFDHNTTDFPLMGGHIGVDCIQCHADGYEGTPTDCAACHLDDYNATTQPDHTDAGFSTDCAACHTEEAWTPATFDHDNTDFPLMGGHIGVDCLQCHEDGYEGTPTDCAACHMDDFNETNNPDHAGEGFPTDCASCHTEQSWVPSTFDHDADHFPIYDGEHEGEWDACMDCHPVAGNFAIFSCTNCHTQNNTAEDHDEVDDYIWESNACLQCHPDGSE
jgi:cytochrome c1